jgi:hypothetical protein
MALTSEGKLYGWGWNKVNDPVPLFESLKLLFLQFDISVYTLLTICSWASIPT